MAEDITTLSLGLGLNLTQLRKDFAQIPGIGAKEARDLAAGIRKELRGATAASAAASKAARDSARATSLAVADIGKSYKTAGMAGSSAAKTVQTGWGAAAKALQQNQLVSELETVASMFTQIGGSVSRASILFTSAIRPVALLGSTLGGVGLAAVAIPVALGGAALAFRAVANSADDARERLVAAGHAVDGEASRNLNIYAQGQRELATTLDHVRVAVGNVMAGDLGILASLLADNVGPAFREAKAGVELFSHALDLATLGATYLHREVGDLLWESLTANKRATMDATQAVRDYDAALTALGAAQKASIDAAGKQNDATADKDAAEGARQQAAADKELALVTAALAKASQDAAEKRAELNTENERALGIDRAAALEVNKRVSAIVQGNIAMSKFEESARQSSEFTAAVIDNMARQTEAYAGSWQQVKDVIASIGPQIATTVQALGSMATSILGDLQTLADMRIASLQAQAQAEAEAAASAVETWADAENKMIDRMEERGQLSQQEADKERVRVNQDTAAKLEASNDLKNDEREAAMESFRRSQSLARIQATIAAALSALALIPSLSYLAWGAPIAAAGLAGGALAAQLVVINAQAPPEFPMGRTPPRSSPDHAQTVSIQDDEGVTSSRGTALIGRDNIQRANMGQSPRGLGQMVQIVLGRQVLAEAMAGTTTGRPIDPRSGRRDPRYRR